MDGLGRWCFVCSTTPFSRPQDAAVYAWDLASLLTHVSYSLTFLSSAAFPESVLAPLEAELEYLMSCAQHASDHLPDLEQLSEHMCATTYQVGMLVYQTMAAAKAKVDHTLAVEHLLTEAGQQLLQSLRRSRVSTVDDHAAGKAQVAAAAQPATAATSINAALALAGDIAARNPQMQAIDSTTLRHSLATVLAIGECCTKPPPAEQPQILGIPNDNGGLLKGNNI